MKYLLIIPSGGGIKTFLCTRFIDFLLDSGEVWIWHTLPEKSVATIRGQWGDRVHWHRLPVSRETLSEKISRQSKAHAQIYWKHADNRELLLQRLKPSGSWLNRSIGLAAGILGRACASRTGIVLLDRWHEKSACRAARGGAHEEFLRHLQPDVVFCTYQRAISAVPAMAAARSLTIPTATFIYSWDNLPKSRIPVSSDYFLVWSELMKDELLGYYPGTKADSVLVVGTPQFEHYSDRSLIVPRDEFLNSLNLDPARPVVCFSGDDIKTSPHDPIYLADLARGLRELPAARRPQILFRPCPSDQSERFDCVLRDYPEIARSMPLWSSETANGDWSTYIPAKDDIRLLTNVVAHCDVVVNVGSTMAMDFAVYDKPGIYLAYNPPGTNGHWSFETIYRLPHFESVHTLQPVYWAWSGSELGELVCRALRCNHEKSAARQAWLTRHVVQPLDQASARCARALMQVANHQKTAAARAGRSLLTPSTELPADQRELTTAKQGQLKA
jgi:hypothetical protein